MGIPSFLLCYPSASPSPIAIPVHAGGIFLNRARETNSGWVRSDQPHVKKLPHGNSSALYLYTQLHINRHSSVPVSLLFPPFLVFGIAFTMDVS
jgi:hypothetical protein